MNAIDDLVERLWASDEASALTNQAAREIERLVRRVDQLEAEKTSIIGEAVQGMERVALEAGRTNNVSE